MLCRKKGGKLNWEADCGRMKAILNSRRLFWRKLSHDCCILFLESEADTTQLVNLRILSGGAEGGWLKLRR